MTTYIKLNKFRIEIFCNHGYCLALAIVSPAHAFLAIASSYYLGSRSAAYFLRSQRQKWVVYLRGLSTLVLALSPLICMISTGALHIDVMSEEGISYYVEGAIEISTWLLHFIYVMTLVERLTPSIRGEFDF